MPDTMSTAGCRLVSYRRGRMGAGGERGTMWLRRGVLGGFGPATRAWFTAAFAAPTAAQAGAWRAIAAGRNALVVAPTGSGKTLAAFLWSLDRLAREPPPAEARQRCRVLYVSPLKALAVDVERNLRAPLDRHPAGRRPARRRPAGHHRRHAHRRHPGRRAPGLRPHPAGHPHHHARVAVPAAHLAGPGVAARRRDGDRRRGARGRRAPSAAPTWRSPWSGSTRCWPGRPSGSACPPRSGRSTRLRPVPRRRPRRSTWCSRRPPRPSRSASQVPVEDMTRLDETEQPPRTTWAAPGRAGRRSGRPSRSGSST